MSQRRKSSIVSVAAPLAADYCATDILTVNLAQDDPKREYVSDEESAGLLSGQQSGSWWDDLYNTWVLAWPIFGTFILQVGPGITNIIFLGHLENDKLGAGTLATMFIQITGNSIGQGLATAMDTLASQAYGAGEYKEVGIILQRGLLILNLTAIPMWAMWFNCEKLLLMVGQEAHTSKLAGDFVYYYSPGLPAMLSYEPLKKYLQAQGIVKPGMYVAAFANVWNVFMNWFLIFGVGWGYLGAAAARITTQWMMVFCILLYMKVTGAGSQTWGGWSGAAFKEWPQFFSLAIPGMLMTAAEAWAFEAMTLAAGYMGNEYLSAQSVIMQFAMYTILVPFSIGVAGTIRVGNALGKGQAQTAKRAAYLSTFLAIITAFIVACLMTALRWTLPRIYTTWDVAIEIAAGVIPLVAFEGVFDAVNICGSGVFRGCGKQMTGFMMNFVAYYVIGLPLGFFMGFKLKWMLFGMWLGMTVALFIIAVVIFVIFARIDWDEEVRKAGERVGSDEVVVVGH